MELLVILGSFLLFIGGFGFGYAVAARGERKRTSKIIGRIDQLSQKVRRLPK